MNLQGEHKVFPWLQTFITRKLRRIQTYFFLPLFKLVSKILCHVLIVMLQMHNLLASKWHQWRRKPSVFCGIMKHVERNWLSMRRSPCNIRSTYWSVLMCCKKISWVIFWKKKVFVFHVQQFSCNKRLLSGKDFMLALYFHTLCQQEEPRKTTKLYVCVGVAALCHYIHSR